MSSGPPYIKSGLPAGRCGDWSIEKFRVGERRRPDNRPAPFRSPAGTYTRLKAGNEVFMTDLHDEWWTQRAAMTEAHARGGTVLVTGLGLGLIVEALLQHARATVTRIVVIERSADVISLVAPHLLRRYRDKLEIVEADAFRWQPADDQRFSVGWHDIWPNPHAPGVRAEAERLEARYAHCCDWQGNWISDYRSVEAVERNRALATAVPSGGSPAADAGGYEAQS